MTRRSEVFAARVRDIVESYANDGVSMRELAKRIGLHPATLSHWQNQNRSTPRDELLEKFCAYTGANKAYLVGYSDDPEPSVAPLPSTAPTFEIDSATFGAVPRIAKTVGAGAGIWDLDHPEDAPSYAFRLGYLRHLSQSRDVDPERWRMVIVAKGSRGDSMVPTIQPGASLLVDRGPGGKGHDNIEPGKIYLVSDDDGLVVKRVYRTDGMLLLVSDNRGSHQQMIGVSVAGRKTIGVSLSIAAPFGN